MNKSDHFITFEGGEGAGKSTLIRRISDALKDKGYEVVLTREPGGTKLGEELRSLLLHQNKPISRRTELFLFLAARIQHIEEVILPALKRNAIVLCDRFSDSTIAYQGEGKGLGFEYVQQLCSQVGLEPSLTFYLDIDPKLGLSRADTRGNSDRMEKEDLQFHERVRKGFKKLSTLYPERIHTLDATLDPETLFHNAILFIDSKL